MEKDPGEPTEAAAKILPDNLEKVENHVATDFIFKSRHKITHGHGWRKRQLVFGIHVWESGLRECNEET